MSRDHKKRYNNRFAVWSIILGLVLSWAAIPVQAADWPQYLLNNDHTSSQNETTLSPANAANISQLWTFKAGKNIASTPVVVGNTVYVGSWDGYEYAVDATTGALRWQTYLGVTNYPNCTGGQPTHLGVYSSANVQNGKVYVGGGDSYWYALNATTGAVLGKVYVGDSSNSGGNYNWSSTITTTVNGTPYAYVGATSNCDNPLVQGKLIKINLTNYTIDSIFRTVPEDYSVGGGIWTSPALSTADNILYLTTGTPGNASTQPYTRAIIAINAATMQLVGSWQIPDSEGLQDDPDWGTSPILFNKNSDSSAHLVAATHKNGWLYAFDRNNLGAGYVWKTQLGIGGDGPTSGEGSVSTPTYGYDSATGNNVLYAAAGDTPTDVTPYHHGTINAINPDTGAILWTHGETQPVIPALTYTNGLIIGVAGGTLDIVDASTGNTAKALTLALPSYSPASVSNGRIFVGAGDGTLTALGIPGTDTGCPTPWNCANINMGTQTGSQAFTNGTLSVTGGGNDIWGTSDSFRFVYHSIINDGTVSANVASQTTPATNEYAKSGVMLRASTDPGAPYIAVLATPSHGLQVQYRSDYNGSSNGYGTSVTANYVKIERVSGGTFLPESSSDGVTWTPLSNRSITLTGPLATTTTLLAGFAVTSHNPSTLNTATFDHLTTSSMPTTCPQDWACTDTNNPALAGGQYKNGALTIWAGGSDIYGTSDQFRFVHQSLAGDGDLAAQITDQLATDSYAKAGLMVRNGTAADAPYYGAFVTPNNGLLIQYRTTAGATTSNGPIVSGVATPTYLRINRSGDAFTTYTSADGALWTAVPGSNQTISALNGAVQAGYAVTSHNTHNLGKASFTSVSLDCHLGWTCGGINETILQPNIDATVTSDLNSWQVQGSGEDIWGTSDSFHFARTNLTGDGGISAQITSQGDTNQYAKAGLMIRDNANPDSPYYDVVMQGTHGVNVQYRTTTGGSAQSRSTTIPTTYPYYFKIVRAGTQYSAYTSTDGQNWTFVPNSTVNINAIAVNNSLIGMAVTSHDNHKVDTATFSHVNVFTNNSCQQSWTCEDVATNQSGLQTSYDSPSNTWVTQGGGSDIWGTTDHFHFNYTTLNGDGSLSTQVVSQTNTNEYAKAGLMIRDSNDPSAAFYDVIATPSHGILVQYRTQFGANAQSIDPGIATTYPVYLKVSRAGTTYSAYTSGDGITWNLIPGSSIDISSANIRTTGALEGNIVTSHDSSAISTAVFTANTLH